MSTHPARKKAALELSPKAAPPKVEDEPEEKRPALNKWQFIKKILDR